MNTKKNTSTYRPATFLVALPAVVCLLMAFLPTQEENSFGLPIDKKNNFLFESGYGERMHPVLGVKRLHTGIDLVAKEGVPVVSTQTGVVMKAQPDGNWGNIIVIKHDGKYATSYSHLKSMNVKPGDKVQKGQEIGWVGHTGMSNKDHLHFELLKNGRAIDPVKYLPEMK